MAPPSTPLKEGVSGNHHNHNDGQAPIPPKNQVLTADI